MTAYIINPNIDNGNAISEGSNGFEWENEFPLIDFELSVSFFFMSVLCF